MEFRWRNAERGGITMDPFNNNQLAGCEVQAPMDMRRPDLTERLQSERNHLMVRVLQIDEALKALAANPDVERIVNLISRL